METELTVKLNWKFRTCKANGSVEACAETKSKSGRTTASRKRVRENDPVKYWELKEKERKNENF